jgi:hypothetical protein
MKALVTKEARSLVAFAFGIAGIGLALISVSANPPNAVMHSGANASRNSAREGQIRHGVYRNLPVTYVVKHGKAIFQGDIILDH